MSAFQGNTTDEFEPGMIMVLTGLSKTAMNGTLVDLQSKIISEVDGNIRWKCVPLKGDDSAAPISIKPDNLTAPPVPSALVLKQCMDLCTEAQIKFRKARNSIDLKLIEKAKKKLGDALVLVPQYGLAVILKFMRRAVANGLQTPDDDERIFKARIGYAGAQGNLKDFKGEQYQLRLCLRSPFAQLNNGVPFCQMLLGESYRIEGEFDNALETLMPLQARHYGEFNGQSIDANLERLFNQVSYEFYKIADVIERNADRLPVTNTVEKEAQLQQYHLARESYEKAMRAAPNDRATNAAWTRINAKINPDLIVTEQNGYFQVLNANDREVNLQSAMSKEDYIIK
eukprot:gene11577-15504_t